MKTKAQYLFIATALIMTVLSTAACHKTQNEDCSSSSDAIDAARTKYYADTSKEHCQTLLDDYTFYIDRGCDADSSYYNVREAFKKAHNDCK